MLRPMYQYLRHHFDQPLYSSAYFIALAAIIPAAAGYVFWVLVARLIDVEQVGIASALLSATAFLTLLSGLDLGTTLIRFLPGEKNAVSFVNTAISSRILLSAVVSTVYLLGVQIWSPSQAFLQQSAFIAILFILTSVLQSINELTTHIFVAVRQSRTAMLKNVYVALARFPILFVGMWWLHDFDGRGVYFAVMFTVLLVIVYAFWRMLPSAIPNYRFRPELDVAQIRRLLHFSLTNFTGELAFQTPMLIMPVIIANLLGNQESGIAYIVIMISGLVMVFPQAISRSLLTESTLNQTQVRLNLIRVLGLSLLVEFVIVTMIIVAGRLLLAVTFGPVYAEHGIGFLILSGLSVIPMTAVLIYFSIQRVQGRTRMITMVGLIVCFTSIVMVFVLGTRYGLTGVGAGLLIGQIAGAIPTLPFLGAILQAPHSRPRQPTEYSSNHKTLSVILDEQLGHLSAGRSVLDIGCGSGSLTGLIQQGTNNQARIIGVDIDLNALKVARKEYPEPSITFMHYDGYALPLPANCIKLAIAQEVIEHVPEAARFMTELARVLDVGGLCLITTPNAAKQPLVSTSHPDHVKHYLPSELQALAVACGFEVVDAYYRYHFFSGLFDRVLLALAHRALPTYEVQDHMTVVDDPDKYTLLHLYDKWVDPIITVIEQMEFKLMRRFPAPAQVCILRKRQSEVAAPMLHSEPVQAVGN